MSAVVFLLVCFLSCSVSEDLQEHVITAKPGDDVTLPCQAPNNVNIVIVEWTRSGLQKHVFSKRDRHLNTVDQDPSYVNRVQLKDDEMKNDDLSLILKNVNNNDKGTYKCRYLEDRGGAVQIKLISIVVLNAKEQTVKSGDDVTLQCQSPKDEAIISLQWNRSDLQTDEYVFFLRDGRINESLQHESFKGRVQLMDPQMKNGDVSVILKNVSTSDVGTYECRVSVNNKKQLMNITILKVKDSGQTSGKTQTEGEKEKGKKDRNLGLKVGLSVVGILLLLAVVGFVIYKNRHRRPFQRVLYRAANTQQV